MNSSRLWTLASIVVIIALIAGTWMVGISPRLAEAATANTDRAGVEFLNATHSATLTALKDQFDDLPELQAALDDLRLAVPETDGTAELFRQLHSTARSAGVTITDLTLSSPERFAAPAEAPADAEFAAALKSVNPDNFLVIPVEQTVVGEFNAVMNYVNALQTGQRTFLIQDLSLGSGLPSADSGVEVMLNGQIFVLLDGASAAPVEGAEPPADSTSVPK